MTAAEEAKEWVHEYYALLQRVGDFSLNWGRAKKCAMIDIDNSISVVEDLEEQVKSILGTDGHEERDFLSEKKQHLQDVKTEIEKL